MKDLLKGPSLFFEGKRSTLSINMNLYSTSIFGGKNEYLAYIWIYAIYVPMRYFLNAILFIVINNFLVMEKNENQY